MNVKIIIKNRKNLTPPVTVKLDIYGDFYCFKCKFFLFFPIIFTLNFYLSSDCNSSTTVKNTMTEKVGTVNFKWVIFLPKANVEVSRQKGPTVMLIYP